MKLSINQELSEFLKNNTGEDFDYESPSEYVSDLIRLEMQKKEAEKVRASLIEAYKNVSEGKMDAFEGDIRKGLKAFHSIILQN